MTSGPLRLSQLALAGGGITLGLAFLVVSLQPIGPGSVTSPVATLLIVATALLLLGLPGLYVSQARASGALGLAGHALLSVGLLLLVLVSAGPILYPAQDVVAPENALLFVLALALTGGLCITGISMWRAAVVPRIAPALLLVGTIGFFFSFFIAELVTPVAGQIATAVSGIALGGAFAIAGLASPA
jgi:hypothetical protein